MVDVYRLKISEQSYFVILQRDFLELSPNHSLGLELGRWLLDLGGKGRGGGRELTELGTRKNGKPQFT